MTKKINLQVFAGDPIQGAKNIYVLRRLADRTQEAATVLAFQEEGTTTMSKDADTVATKDGTIRVPGAAEIELSLTSILTTGDPMIAKLKTALLNGEVMEIWEVNTAEKGTGENADKYPADYYRGYLTNYEKSSNSEDFAELSLDIGVFGNPQSGYVTLSREQEEAALYAFADVAKAADTDTE
ncbi:phage major tail protein, TP901-1 family [uncultured Faecalibaculum sp.]|uniref:phage major tail protein, TP901-1 family n=1 Tax=uncultured Faecalibaculum sp. TaxID=1729681 RepID=UPI0025EC4439|nr:phage major tail protein, TP901-1 family [uncultured Faecalibaculum sp.]